MGENTLHNSHKQYKITWYDYNQTSERSTLEELEISEERIQKMLSCSASLQPKA
jgi:replication initiation and membrane attachment protein DnaB